MGYIAVLHPAIVVLQVAVRDFENFRKRLEFFSLAELHLPMPATLIVDSTISS